MNVVVMVHDCYFSGTQIVVTIHVCTSNGETLHSDVPVDFAASATVMRTRITDRAKALLVETGVPGAATATYRLFGGPA